MSPAALLFDVGNVLIEVDFARVAAAWGRAAGVSAASILERFCVDEAYCAHEMGTLDEAGYFAYLRKRLDLALDDEAFLAGWNEVFVAPVPGMQALLEAASEHLPLYGFSNTNRSHAAYFRPRYAAVLAPLRELICSCELGHRKPDPAAFREVARRLGHEPARIAFFDDLEDNVRGAREAGMTAFVARSAADVRAALERLSVLGKTR